MSETNPQDQPIAIVGLGALFPRAQNARELWRNIRSGVDAISEIPASHWNPDDYFDGDPSSPDRTYARRGGFLGVHAFDPVEFGIPPSQLEATDTAQLLGLVCARMALDDAGYTAERAWDRSRTSVILGVTGTLELVIPLGARLGHPLWRKALLESGVAPEKAQEVVERIAEKYVPWQEASFPGLLGNVVAGRIANRLDLGGTNCVVDAACASSLGAAHLAALELASGRADMVVTGGVDTFNDIFMFMCFSKTPALSPTGDAKPFDEHADGTILGEGIGMVVLKRLDRAEKDGDRIYAVIRGIGSSSDGRSKSIYAPRPEGQAKALRSAYANAGVSPATIELVEAHGTGTKVGDVAEAEGLASVYREARKGTGREGDATPWCALGSIKSQIGHTKAAAGAAGLIKAALALHHKVVPPTIKVKQPNPKLPVGAGEPFYLATEPRPWLARPEHPRRAGVSSFGFGGSNFHVVLEEHRAEKTAPSWDGSVELVALSAPTAAALDAALAEWEKATVTGLAGKELARRAALSRQELRREHAHRLVLVVETLVEGALAKAIARARAALAREPEKAWDLPEGVYHGVGAAPGKLALLFPGQGSQYVGMLRDLACVFPEVARELEAGSASAIEGARLSDRIYPAPAFEEAEKKSQQAALTATQVAQPALGAVSLGALRVLERLGVTGEAALGHSFGELTALAAAGRISAAELHRLARLRGELMAKAGASRDAGSMLAVQAPLAAIEKLLADEKLDLVLANRNTPAQGVLSGSKAEIARAAKACEARGLRARELPVAAAFHSTLVAAAAEPFRRALDEIAFAAGSMPVLANTTGAAYPADPAAARDLLGQQLAKPVDFAGAVERLHAQGFRTFVEVGPKAVLTGLVRATLEGRPFGALALDASSGSRSGLADLGRAVAQLAALGHAVNLAAWEPDSSSLPPPPAKPRHTVPLTGANYRSASTRAVPRPPAGVPAAALGTKPHASPAPASLAPPTPAARPLASANGNGAATNGNGATHGNGAAKNGTAHAPAPAALGIPAPSPLPARGAPLPDTTTRTTTRTTTSTTRSAVNDTPAAERGSELPIQPARRAPAADLIREAFRASQESLRAFQALQEQTAALHRRFLEGQESAHASFATLVQGQQRLVERALGLEPSTPAPAPLELPRATPSSRERTITAEVSGTARALPAPSFAPAPAAARPVVAPLAAARPASAPLASAPLASAPAARPAPAAAPALAAARPAAAAPAHPSTAAPARPVASAPAAPASNGADAARLAKIILEVVAEKTGYPLDTLELDMDMESDLGIDSIKRVEILSGVQERAPEAPSVEPERLGSLRTLRQVTELMASKTGHAEKQGAAKAAPGSAPTAPGAVPASGVGHGQGHEAGGLDLERFAKVLLAVVAEKTGYPLDTLELDMDMESDLGIDSIKRVEILSGVQERAPDAPAVEPERLGSLRTLRQVVDFLGQAGARKAAHAASARPHAPAASSHAASAPTLPEAARSGLPRRVLRGVDLTPAHGTSLALAPRHELWVTDDGSALARALVGRLEAAGTPARLVPLAGLAERAAPVAGLVVLAPAATHAGAAWPPASEKLLAGAFELAKTLASDLRAAGRKGGAVFVTVSRLDGAFGLGTDPGRESVPDPVSGGLAGIAKTAADEWPEVRCRALDLDLSWTDANSAADALARELAEASPLEVGLAPGKRRALELVEAPVGPLGGIPLAPGDVVVVTGGARGVTAETALALANAARPTLLLLGRTAEPEAEPEHLSGVEGEAALKQAVAAELARRGERPAPKVVGETVRRVLADREVRRNLERLRAVTRTLYRSADIRDAAALGRVLDEVRASEGPIRGVVHGAGVIEDRRIEEKTREQFESVVSTKVAGLRALLEALAPDELRALVLFSSVSGRFGRRGQVDYAAANEVLNKVARREAARRPGCRVLSLGWGPWEGGMVTPALKAQFAKEGVALIGLEQGGRALVEELAATETDIEITLGGELPKAPAKASGSAPARRPVAASGFAVAFERTLDLARHPFLRSHLLGGRPVLPAAVMVEWLAHGALHGNPGLLFHGLDDLRVTKGVALEGENARPLRVAAGPARREGSLFLVPVELRGGPAAAEILHARATAVLAGALPAAPAFALPGELAERPYPRTIEQAYDEVLFHGEHLRGLEAVVGISSRGIVARSQTAPAPQAWMAEPVRSNWLADPLALDGAFQLAILWCQEELGARSLPAHLSRYRQYRAFPREGVTISFVVSRKGPHSATGELAFTDASGALVARVEGYECTVDASLGAAFRAPAAVHAPPA